MQNAECAMHNAQCTIVVSAEPTDIVGDDAYIVPMGGCGHPPLRNGFYIVRLDCRDTRPRVSADTAGAVSLRGDF